MGNWSLKMSTEKWKNVSGYVKLNVSYANDQFFFFKYCGHYTSNCKTAIIIKYQ
jgi:hypothetical protein